MADVISVRFRGGSKTYYFDPQDLQVSNDDFVIVETAQGLEYARCIEGNHEVPDQSVVQPLRPVVRIATAQDHRTAANNYTREKEAFGICEKKIAAHKLDMKLVNVECSFEGNKIIFFFTAEGRVDFRELVKDLASVFRARIELRQIGVRDGAKMLGGLGICGRPLCCAQFLDEFIPVSIKMAKTQNLSLNPTKISGTCGRLMCCLKYEQNAYEDAARRMPKNDSFVMTPDGPGNVTGVDLLREEASVRLDSSPESPRKYKGSELNILRNGKGTRDGIEIPKERPARYEAPQEEKEVPMETRLTSDWDVEAPAAAREETPHREKDQGASRRHHRTGSRRSGEKPAQREGGEKAPQPRQEKGPKPQGGQPRPGQARNQDQQKPRQEKAPRKPRQDRQDRPARKPRPEQQPDAAPKFEVEKVQVRTTTDTTAELKAAADRAAKRQQTGDHPADQKKPAGGENRAHRRPRYRPRKKSGGQGGDAK